MDEPAPFRVGSPTQRASWLATGADGQPKAPGIASRPLLPACSAVKTASSPDGLAIKPLYDRRSERGPARSSAQAEAHAFRTGEPELQRAVHSRGRYSSAQSYQRPVQASLSPAEADLCFETECESAEQVCRNSPAGTPQEGESTPQRRDLAGGATPRLPSLGFLEPYEPYSSPRLSLEAVRSSAALREHAATPSLLRGLPQHQPQPLVLPTGEASPPQTSPHQTPAGRQGGESALARFRAVTMAHAGAAAFRRAGEGATSAAEPMPVSGARLRKLGLQLDFADGADAASTPRPDDRGERLQAAVALGTRRPGKS